MDRPGFDADAFVKRAIETSSLEELLRTYARVLGEIRALDAEKKGLVYDNYSRLITATETIRKVREGNNGHEVMQGKLLTSRTDACKYGPSEPHGVDARPGHRSDILPGGVDPGGTARGGARAR